MNKFIALILVFVFPVLAHSEDVGRIDLEITTNSVHFQKRMDGREWNQSNPGFAVAYVWPHRTLWEKEVDYCVTAGTVKNSEYGQTAFVGGCIRKELLTISYVKVSVGAFAGVMNYPSKYNPDRRAGDLFPAVLPTLTVSVGERLSLDATFIPKVQEKQGSAAILFGVRYGFDFP